MNAAETKPGHTIIVMGIGGIGINAVQGAKHAGEEDPYRKTGAEGSSGDLDDGLDAEDTGDRDRQDD